MQDLRFGNEFLGMTSKPQTTKEKTYNCTSSNKLLHFKDYYQENKKTTCRMGKKITNHLFDDGLILRNIKNSYNSETNNTIQNTIQNGQWMWVDISPKKMHKCPERTWKEVSYHCSSGKCKSNVQNSIS